jgi:hypothetical protein
MIRSFLRAGLAAGLLVVAWIGAGYWPASPLALLLVALIAAFFVMGALELDRYQGATAALGAHLAATMQPPPELAPWLSELPASLRNAVRLRVEGERVALPGPALTPYLAGLLVLLGMLGTFLGMVVTLKGTGLALENASDVDAIRASLAVPIKGLGLAFGTSVAGVAASALLGLMSALARRERQQVAQRLDALVATMLRPHSRAHQREESLRLLGLQAQALPALVNLGAQIQALVERMDRQGPDLALQMERQARALNDDLLASQMNFQGEARKAYTSLAESVGQSLHVSLAESARLAGAVIQPVVQATFADLSRQTTVMQDKLGSAVHQQLADVTATLQATSVTLLDGMAERQQALDHRTHAALAATVTAFESEAAGLLLSVGQAHEALDAAASARDRDRLALMKEHLAGMASSLHREGQQAGAAMAAVVGEMRHALSDSLVRDNAVLDERNRLMTTLAGLLEAVNHASTEQRSAVEALVRTTGDVLERTGAGFAQTVQTESEHLQGVAAQVSASAVEVASLGEGFSLAVQLFSRASEQLGAQLQRIEAALGQSMARSDDQLAYYVAQAREIIDLTLGSQKQIVVDLQQLSRAPAPPAAATLAADAA